MRVFFGHANWTLEVFLTRSDTNQPQPVHGHRLWPQKQAAGLKRV